MDNDLLVQWEHYTRIIHCYWDFIVLPLPQEQVSFGYYLELEVRLYEQLEKVENTMILIHDMSINDCTLKTEYLSIYKGLKRKIESIHEYVASPRVSPYLVARYENFFSNLHNLNY